MAFDLIAFDCDGVLVDTEPVVNRVFVTLLAQQGTTLDETKSLVRFTGVSMADRIAAVTTETGWRPEPDYDARFDAELDAALHHELRMIPGVDAVVRALTGARCVVSNGSRAEITLKLSRTGLLDAFGSHLFSATELPRAKPHPDVYLHAAKAMGIDPRRAAAIEDSVPGVTAAVAAGFTVFGYGGATSGERLGKAGAHPFNAMSELPALLGLGSRVA
jgi:HAD superfamily hydrolase (TIGR01509 family)